jgi:GT2 family glycosyltransferase
MIDLCVLGYGQFGKTTQQCLISLIAQAQEIGAIIHVLDNGSPDDSALLQKNFCASFPEVRSSYSEINLGYAGGMKQIALKGSGQWLVLVGSDTIFTSESLKRLDQALQKAPQEVGIVGPVTNSAGTAQSLSSLGVDIDQVLAQAPPFFSHPTGLMLPLYRADFFCVAIRRTLWNTLHGLDPIYGLGYYEDFDFSMRAKKIGFQCMMAEDVLVYHQGSASFKKSNEQKKLLKKNKTIFSQRFPEAEMRHIRLDNYKIIQYLLDLNMGSFDIHQRQAIIKHLQLRIDSLSEHQPKGWIKRTLWKERVQSLRHQYQNCLEATSLLK